MKEYKEITTMTEVWKCVFSELLLSILSKNYQQFEKLHVLMYIKHSKECHPNTLKLATSGALSQRFMLYFGLNCLNILQTIWFVTLNCSYDTGKKMLSFFSPEEQAIINF